jgi:hypothetical protein
MQPDVLERLRHRARHEHARVVLEQVVAACDEGGIAVLPVKGVVTGRLFYADPGERPIQDVDLRVRPRDMAAVARVGCSAGWRVVSRSRAYETLSFAVEGFLVEFECHVGPPGLSGLRVDDMLRRAERSESGLRPELHDHALLLCVNAFKDKLVEATRGAVRDLELLPAQPSFDPARFAALAAEARTATIAWIVATWLAEERRAQGWRAVRAHLGAGAPRPAYARLFGTAIRSPRWPRTALRLLARAGGDSPRQRARAAWTLAARAMESGLDLAAKVGLSRGNQQAIPACGSSHR